MSGFTRFLRNEPALAPLFIAVGGGLAAAAFVSVHYLRSGSDVVVNRSIQDPWNNVAQDKNTKFLSYNKEWWQSRVGMADPRAMFMGDNDSTSGSSNKSVADRARELRDSAKNKDA